MRKFAMSGTLSGGDGTLIANTQNQTKNEFHMPSIL
jgi:hypothetical protein